MSNFFIVAQFLRRIQENFSMSFDLMLNGQLFLFVHFRQITTDAKYKKKVEKKEINKTISLI